jgi:hypothetical protein
LALQSAHNPMLSVGAQGDSPEAADESADAPENSEGNAIESTDAGGSNPAGLSAPTTPTAASTISAAGPTAFTMLVSPENQSQAADKSSAAPDASDPTAGATSFQQPTVTTATELAQLSANLNGEHRSETQGNSLESAPVLVEGGNNANDRSARTQEPSAPAATELNTDSDEASKGVVRNVQIKLQTENNQRVDVRLTDLGGTLRVSVRAGDQNLANSLQSHMPELTDRLDQQHFRTEVWMPRTEAAETGQSNTQNFNSRNGDQSGDQSGGRQQGRQNNRSNWPDEDSPQQRGNKEKVNQTWAQ